MTPTGLDDTEEKLCPLYFTDVNALTSVVVTEQASIKNKISLFLCFISCKRQLVQQGPGGAPWGVPVFTLPRQNRRTERQEEPADI